MEGAVKLFSISTVSYCIPVFLFVILLESAPYVHCQNCALDYLIHSFEQKIFCGNFIVLLCVISFYVCALCQREIRIDQPITHSTILTTLYIAKFLK